jgi:hypothetical protein
MKKIIFLLLILFLLNDLTSGQDLIVRKTGDTINCTVTKIDSNIVYYKIRFHDQQIITQIYRKEISDLIVPVLPDDPIRILCEKKIKKNTPLLIASGFSFIFGGAMIIYGTSETFKVENGAVYIDDYDKQESGMKKTKIGIPFVIAGAVVGSISLTKVIKYKKQLKNLYKLSIDMDYGPIYNGFTICYKF